jgi:hypothetical protein
MGLWAEFTAFFLLFRGKYMINQAKKLSVAVAVSALFAAGTVNAANFDFSGNIANHNDVIEISFSLASAATNVNVWTDSYLSGVNFDPITAVWVQSGLGYNLVGQNDDRSNIAPGQTIYDSGLTFANLAAGNYMFTIAAYNNWAAGSTLAQGFVFDAQTPISLSTWCQPASHCGMGTYYNVHLSGVDSAVNQSAVPEPETYAMLMLGLGLLGFTARRKKNLSA